MKSHLLSELFAKPDSEETHVFLSHLESMFALTEDARLKCLNVLSEIRLARTAHERAAIIDQLDNALPAADRSVISNCMSVMRFFLEGLSNPQVPPNDYQSWVTDLRALDVLDDSTELVFTKVIDYIRQEILPCLDPEIKRRRAAGGVLPVLASSGATVELRAVRKERYRFGMPLLKYQSEILDVVPIVSIQIGVDFGHVKNIFFQAEEQELDYLIDMLTSAKQDMITFREFFHQKHLSKKHSDENTHI